MARVADPAAPEAAATTRPVWAQVLRALRESRGVSQEGWAASLGISRKTVQRWEAAETVPDQHGERQLVALCEQRSLFGRSGYGDWRGPLTAEDLRELLAQARLGAAQSRAGRRSQVHAVGRQQPSRARTASPYVFISYASSDRARALRLADALEDAGIAPWIDRRSIAGGRPWSAEIVRAITQCGALLLCCSPAALASKNVQQEVQLAWEEQRPIVPLLFARVELPEAVRYPLAGRQWVEVLSRPLDAWRADVLRALAALGVPSQRPPGAALAADPVGRTRTAEEAGAAQHASSVPVHNMPAQLTRCIGREHEIAAITRLLDDARLVTLTGPGGSGKTRLALAAAERMLTAFADGVCFVDLSAVRDPELVPSAIAQALNLRAPAEEPVLAVLSHALVSRNLLLILDNFEQVTAAAPQVGTLLAAAPKLHVLATSREPLHLRGERELPVPPLALPDAVDAASLDTLAQTPAVALLVDRAGAIQPDFALTRENAEAVVAICRRLDGLPLAIELAAARLKLLTPQAVLARLALRSPLLAQRAQDAPARQQTLERTVAWSYDLLTPDEQALFRRLAVFPGGFTLEAVEAVLRCDGLAADALLEKSLLIRRAGVDGAPRFAMLETIREFAEAKLADDPQEPGLRRGLAQHMLQFAERAEAGFRGADHAVWLRRLQAERDNLWAAIAWCQAASDGRALGLRLATALVEYWVDAGFASEGRRQLEQLLESCPEAAAPLRAAAMQAAGNLAFRLGDYDRATRWCVAAVKLFRQGDDALGMARSLHILGHVEYSRGALPDAAARFADCLQRFRELGEPQTVALLLNDLGSVWRDLGDNERALDYLEQGLALARDLKDPYGISHGLRELATVAQLRGDLARAALLFEEALLLLREYGDKIGIATVLCSLGALALLNGDTQRAASLQRESIEAYQELGDRLGMVQALEGLAAVRRAEGDPVAAAKLYAAAASARVALGAPLPPGTQLEHDAALATLRSILGEAEFARASAAGSSLTLDQAVAAASRQTA